MLGAIRSGCSLRPRGPAAGDRGTAGPALPRRRPGTRPSAGGAGPAVPLSPAPAPRAPQQGPSRGTVRAERRQRPKWRSGCRRSRPSPRPLGPTLLRSSSSEPGGAGSASPVRGETGRRRGSLTARPDRPPRARPPRHPPAPPSFPLWLRANHEARFAFASDSFLHWYCFSCLFMNILATTNP